MKELTLDEALLFFRTPHKFYNAMKRNLSPPRDITLNQTQAHTLLFLREKGALPMHTLGKLTGIIKGSLTQVVDVLVEDGLAERKRDPEDRRSVLVSITPDGLRLTERLDKNLIEHIQSILLPFDEKKTDELLTALHTLQSSLELIEKREKDARE